MALTIVLTAGGTREPIDDVRYVSNVATGALPAAIADVLLALGHHVYYIHGPGAVLPGHAVLDLDLTATTPDLLRSQTLAWLTYAILRQQAVGNGRLTLLPVQTAQQVTETLADTCRALQPDAVGCAMAVADFSPVPSTGKLSSRQAHLTLEMAPTAKAIAGVKSAAPRTRLLGFKLLSGATDADFLEAAERQIARAGSDLVFCNDMQDLHKGLRRGLLIAPGGRIHARIEGGAGTAGLHVLAAEIVTNWLPE